MRTIDPVADVGRLSERLEPVQKTRRYVKMPKSVVVEEKCLLSPERRRVLPDVNQHIVHRAVRTAHQLGLATPGSSVQAPDHALPRARLRILHEARGGPGRA